MAKDVTASVVDGIPVFRAVEDGPARCALVFRVGTSDESLATAGTTHAVEHLAMHALGRTPHGSNAFVDPLRTVFYAAGERGEAVAFLRDVCAALTRPPLERLELERRILLTEAARRSAGAPEELLTFRFGPRTYGLRAYPEHGLRRLDEPMLAQWTSSRFTRASVALWTNFPLPRGFSFDLSDGERILPAEPHTVDPLPVRAATNVALGLDVVAPRSAALGAAWRALRSRMHDVLRREHGLVYDVGIDLERVGRDSRRFVLLTDPLPEVRYRAAQLMVRTLEQVLQDGFTAQEVDAERTAALRSWDEPGAGLALADACAVDTLLDVPRRALAEQLAEQHELSAGALLDALRAASGAALLAVPDEVVSMLPLGSAARWSTTWTPGQSFAPSAPVVAETPAAASRRLLVGTGGVTLALNEAQPVTVAFPQCEAVLTWGDGSRRFIGSDGFQVHVTPWEWHGGEVAVAELDRATPSRLVVPMGDGQGPPAGHDEALAAAGAAGAPGAPTRRLGGRYAWLGLWAVLSVVVALFALAPTELSTSGLREDLQERGCDRPSSLSVLRNGPGPAVDQSTFDGRALAAACLEESEFELQATAFGALSLAACGVTTAWNLQRAGRWPLRRPAQA